MTKKMRIAGRMFEKRFFLFKTNNLKKKTHHPPWGCDKSGCPSSSPLRVLPILKEWLHSRELLGRGHGILRAKENAKWDVLGTSKAAFSIFEAQKPVIWRLGSSRGIFEVYVPGQSHSSHVSGGAKNAISVLNVFLKEFFDFWNIGVFRVF